MSDSVLADPLDRCWIKGLSLSHTHTGSLQTQLDSEERQRSPFLHICLPQSPLPPPASPPLPSRFLSLWQLKPEVKSTYVLQILPDVALIITSAPVLGRETPQTMNCCCFLDIQPNTVQSRFPAHL